MVSAVLALPQAANKKANPNNIAGTKDLLNVFLVLFLINVSNKVKPPNQVLICFTSTFQD